MRALHHPDGESIKLSKMEVNDGERKGEKRSFSSQLLIRSDQMSATCVKWCQPADHLVNHESLRMRLVMNWEQKEVVQASCLCSPLVREASFFSPRSN